MKVKAISKIKNIKKENCTNKYKHKIESYIAEQGYNFFDHEVILYAIGLKDDIISSLKKLFRN